jgi:hypothetical protein
MKTAEDDIYSGMAQQFTLLMAQRGLSRSDVAPALLMSDVVAYVRGVDCAGATRVEEALRDNLAVRRQLRTVLEAEHLAFAPRAARADDGTQFDTRETPEFTLDFRASRADAGQVYIVLTLEQTLASPGLTSVTLVAVRDDEPRRLVFNDMEDGQGQLLVDASDERLHWARDARAELFLLR